MIDGFFNKIIIDHSTFQEENYKRFIKHER
jgi:hypothetical protein